jgi:hypothetical protein
MGLSSPLAPAIVRQRDQFRRLATVLTQPPLAQSLTMPASLDGHDIPPERLTLIAAHVRALADTARDISDTLPLTADAGDFAATLDTEET